MTDATPDRLLGTQIDRYRLERLLGAGGMGRVYLGVQPAIGSRVAIKVLSEECTRIPDLLERFFAEARSVNLIRHESIVSVLDLATLPDGRPYIIMEFIEGHTLGHHVRSGDAPLGGVLQVMGEVLSGLAAAHAIGIVHRDLKPDNILVTVEGHAKILDFGVAKLAPGMRGDASPRTATGALLGTPAYMAPEQISGAQNVDARTDIYACGVVLYEAVVGRAPFAGNTLFDLMRAHLEQSPPSPRAVRPEIPVELEAVILQSLAKDPAHRFQSAQAMGQALAHVATVVPPDQWRALSSRQGGTGLVPTPSMRTPTPRRELAPAPGPEPLAVPSRSRAGRWVLLGVAGTLALAIVSFVLGGSSKEPAPAPTIAESPVAPVAPPATPGSAPTPPVAPGANTAPAPPSTPVPSSSPHSRAPTHAMPLPPAPTPAPPDPRSTLPVPVAAIARPTPSTPPTLTLRADYDPKRFDPVGYLPKAVAIAQKLVPDAQLDRFDFDPVFDDGHVDLTMAGRDRAYRFASPANSARPAGVPRNASVELPCRIDVEMSAGSIEARVISTDDCQTRRVRAPHCRFASVWKQALAGGASAGVTARISWLSDETWYFNTDLDGAGAVQTLQDRCD